MSRDRIVPPVTNDKDSDKTSELHIRHLLIVAMCFRCIIRDQTTFAPPSCGYLFGNESTPVGIRGLITEFRTTVPQRRERAFEWGGETNLAVAPSGQIGSAPVELSGTRLESETRSSTWPTATGSSADSTLSWTWRIHSSRPSAAALRVETRPIDSETG